MRYLPRSVLIIVIFFPTITFASSTANLEAAKSRMQDRMQGDSAQENKLKHGNINVEQAYGRTIITGWMDNREDISASGTDATAAGNQINIGNINNGDNNITGNRIDVKETQGSVYVRVNTKSSGNISANSSGIITKANAAGTQINVKGVRGIVNVNAKTSSNGNITANATGFSNVEANATANQINIQGNSSAIRVNGVIISNGNITATAKGGIMEALKDE
ncbi:MAG TPA: hypothetical protein ENK59_01090 [Thioploca sp.]|nr:hypothetical protein [Thioploca sp.]